MAQLKPSKLDYESHRVRDSTPASIQIKELRVPLVFLTIGLCIYAARILYIARDQSAAYIMGFLLLTVTIETGVGISLGCRRGYCSPDDSLALWSATLKLAACIVFCSAVGGLVPFGGWFMLALEFRLIMWIFEVTFNEALAFIGIRILLRIAILIVLRMALR